MKDSARIQAVIDILNSVANEQRPSDAVISAYFRANRYIGSKDRVAVSALVYDIIRNRARLGWHYARVQGTGDGIQGRHLVLLFLALVKKETAASIAGLFNGEKFAPAILGFDEKKLLRETEGSPLVSPDMPEQVRLECPDWAYEKLKRYFGDRLQAEMTAMLEAAPLDLRVNPIKATRAMVLEKLKAAGTEAKPTIYSPYGIRVAGRPPIAQSDLYEEGLIEIQDEGSQLVALVTDARPGMSVVDFCAGAGGKTLALAASMNNKGRVVACDVLGGRLKRGRERFRRAGLHNIEIHELKNENDQWVKRNAGKYDRVLVDAPCSGAGTWRRNPDARWKKLGPSLDELTGLQARILASAARLVKPGGRLVYATCSMLAEENRMQVDAFLAAHANFTLVPVASILPAFSGEGAGENASESDCLDLTPARHGTDGFFAAVMERNNP